jgi:hypothetical protein
MVTIRNINEAYGMPECFTGDTLADAVATMQQAIRDCGPEFVNVVVTEDDYEVVLSDDDKRALGRLCTRDDAGRHFTEAFDSAWLDAMEAAGLITIHRPVHEQTGIPYGGEYWSVEVAPEVAEWFDDCGELID